MNGSNDKTPSGGFFASSLGINLLLSLKAFIFGVVWAEVNPSSWTGSMKQLPLKKDALTFSLSSMREVHRELQDLRRKQIH
jgi:hypothetical protein